MKLKYFFKYIILISLISINLGGIKMNTRKAMYAGSWYPGDKKEIISTIELYLKNAKKTEKIEGDIKVLVVPHAGWIYSGQVAAYGFQYIKGMKFDDIILMGGSHHEYIKGAALPSFEYYSTPLGEIAIDKDAIDFLTDYSEVFKVNDSPHIPEHSLEIELPFLQYLLKGDWKLIPIIFGSNDYHSLVSAAKAITEFARGKKVLVVVSTDMSHYHSYDEAVKMDRKAIEYVQNMDISGLINALQRGEVEYCGYMALLTGMLYASQIQATNVYDIYYANSGDVTGDKSRVVGYTSIIFSKTEQAEEDKVLSDDAKVELLKLARLTIETYLKTGKKPDYKPKHKELKKIGAAFVTLEKHGRLRGCIGQIIAMEPLYKCVIDMAVSAAVNDPRFPQVTQSELEDIDIEISVLTPLQRVKKIDEIKVGRDGLYIKKGYYSGLLLPQVATDYGWNREEFLMQVCHKAGLPPMAWKESDAELYRFQAVVFSEGDFGLK